MRIYTIFTLFLIAFLLNGCIVDRIKKRIFVQRQIAKQKQEAEKNNKLRQKAITEKNKVYKPSKPSVPLYTEENNVKVQSKVKKSVHKKHKKIVKKHKYAKKKVTIKPEPYSIEKNEGDPELLGPQTTLKANPLSKIEKITKEKNKG